MRPRRRAAVARAAVAFVAVAFPGVLLLSGCTSFADTLAAEGSAGSTRAGTSPSPEAAPKATCPAERAAPDPDRPIVDLTFRLEDDRRTVTGSETVTFTPDLPVDELVFRLTPNGPDSADTGNHLQVGAVRGSDVADSRYEAAGGAAPGGLYLVELDEELAPGQSTSVTLDFTLDLGQASFDRFGTDEGVSWWASGAPLLAWEPGVGWAEDPFVALSGETATSPAADTTVEVSAPEALTVLMTGEQAEPSAPRDGRRTWTSTEPAARDVSVAAGMFTTEERATPDGVRVTGGVLPGASIEAGRLADQTVAAIADLETYLGPFPYRTLTVPLLPDYGGGIEYPSSILLATPNRSVLVHEVAHMWFYGMVGNSQFRDPWLDEAFATYAEALVDPGSAAGLTRALDLDGDVGAAMDDFVDERRYFGVVYGKGAAALLAARQAAGAAEFDAAIRCYVDASAWTIATPTDVRTVLDDLRDAVRVLNRAHALGKDDVPR
ncbi:MAG: uncharacterized protein JWQ99_3672 [Blastococcus sp.]|jgi:hypothetical protein|nr:uncharacterized protein [Blastococcus sp.]